MNPFEPGELVETAVLDSPPRGYDSAISALLVVILLILLACSPAIVILVWKVAL